MKKKILSLILCGCMIIGLSGCAFHWSYRTQTAAIDNKYFKSDVVWEDAECTIIRNEITGEYFILTCGAYGVSLCPIEVNEDEEGFLVSNKR